VLDKESLAEGVVLTLVGFVLQGNISSIGLALSGNDIDVPREQIRM
jgi:hypothetical protein